MASAGREGGRPGAQWLRPLAWIVGWLLLAVPVARMQLAEVALANRMPGRALAFQPHHARALASVATALQLGGRQQQAITFARAALAREPMNLAALRTLGLAREQLGDRAGADRVMFLAARLGWRDAALQFWLLRAYAQQGRYRSVLQRADALARTNHLPQVTFPVFLAYTRNDRMRAALVEAMADRPFWRGIFFYRMLELPAEQMPYISRLVSDLDAAGTPITPAERNIYLTRLVQLGQGGDALAYWLRSERAMGVETTGLSWDGGFEHVPPRGASAAPFEWQLSPQSASVVSVVPAERGQQLSVSPGHDYNGTLASQTLVLAPGRYRLSVEAGGDAASAGLRWTVRCVPGQNELPVDAGRDGTGFAAATFEVPAGGDCAAQSLAIDMASGDVTGSAQVTLDNVTLRRIG